MSLFTSFTNIPGGYITPNGNVVLSNGGSGFVTPNGNIIVNNPVNLNPPNNNPILPKKT